MLSSLLAPLETMWAPAAAADRLALLRRTPFAHRGLHGPGTPENSRAAIDAAIAAGHGVEIDVRLSRDGEAFVFHDATLERLTAATGAVEQRSASELATIRLRDSHETIPRLSDLLARVRGRVPVLIEIKSPPAHVDALSLAVQRALEGYRGAAGVMSFDARAVAWFRTNAPRILRGLVLSDTVASSRFAGMARLRALAATGAQFAAFDVRDLPSRTAARWRRQGRLILAWTIRDAAAEDLARAHADQLIYERPGASS
jgi:glycerophosphoryl diester phosphodiesterase